MKAIAFHRANHKNYFPPAELDGIELVGIAKLFGVFSCKNDIGARKEINYMTHICNQRLYLPNQITKQGLP